MLEEEEEDRVEVRIKEKRGNSPLLLEVCTKTQEETYKVMKNTTKKKNGRKSSIASKKPHQLCLDLALGLTSSTSRTLHLYLAPAKIRRVSLTQQDRTLVQHPARSPSPPIKASEMSTLQEGHLLKENG